MKKILEVEGLTRLYKNNRGIRNVSFEVFEGDIFGLLGPNGAGKTTTMKVITGLTHPDKGKVRLFRQDLEENFEGAMEQVGCIIETPRMYEYLTAAKNLELAARYYSGIDSARVLEVLELVGLEKFKDEKVRRYSLGMKQRLGLALAILSKPRLVILDEPANGLDIEGAIAIRNIILKLSAEQGIAFIISSHQIHEMESICTRIGIMDGGELVKTVDTKEALKNHASLEEFFVAEVNAKREGERGCVPFMQAQ